MDTVNFIKKRLAEDVEKPLVGLATELQKQGVFKGSVQEIVTHILRNVTEILNIRDEQ
jgi:hypothetical protein